MRKLFSHHCPPSIVILTKSNCTKGGRRICPYLIICKDCRSSRNESYHHRCKDHLREVSPQQQCRTSGGEPAGLCSGYSSLNVL